MIYIIRHGKTKNNKLRIVQGRTDTELSKEGIEEIKKFSYEFKKMNINFDSFYSSPLKRSKETLEIIMKYLGYTNEIILDECLLERFFGEAEGIKYGSALVKKRICNDYYPSMEKNNELEKRVYEGMLNIAKDNINKNILIVSHSHAIKAFIKSIDKEYGYEEPTNNLNINIFDYKNGSFKIVEINKDII